MPTYYAQVTYTGNGSTTDYSITFDFIDSSHVKAFLDGTETSAFTISSSTLSFTTAPSSGATIRIERQTPIDERLVDFTDGSVLTESDLDKSANQNFYVAQEVKDDQENNLQIDTDDKYNASSKVIKNVANPTNDQDAVTKHYLENTWLSSSDKTNLTTVAGKSTELGRLGTADAVADMNTLGTADVVADMNTLATSDVVADMNLLATSDVISDMNTLAVADVISDMNTLATASNVTNMDTLAGISSDITTLAGFNSSDISTLAGFNSSNISTLAGFNSANINTLSAFNSANIDTVAGIGSSDISTVAGKATEIGRLGTADAVADMNTLATADNVSNMNSCADNISGINSFAERYRVGATDPTTSNDEGDLFFNTTTNRIRFYNGTSWADIDTGIQTETDPISPAFSIALG